MYSYLIKTKKDNKMSVRRLLGGFVPLIALAWVFGVGNSSVVHAVDQVCDWTGAGGNNSFSTPANWSNCGSAAPGASDIVRFPDSLTTNTNLVNDLGVPLAGVLTVPNPANNSYAYLIDTISLTDGAYIDVETSAACDKPTKVTFQQINSSGAVTVNTEAVSGAAGGQTYNISGALSFKNRYGQGYNGAQSGSSASEIIVKSPFVYSAACQNAGGMGAAPNGPYDIFAAINYNGLTIEKGASVSLGATYSKPIVVGGGTGTQTPKIFYFGMWNNEGTETLPTNVLISGPVTLNSNLNISIGSRAVLRVTGSLTGTGKIEKATDATGTVIIESNANSSTSENGKIELPSLATVISDTQEGLITVVDNQRLSLQGERTDAYVAEGGVLTGTGLLTGRLYVEVGAVIAPGNSPGCITVGTLKISGEYEFELGGAASCSGYDEIIVTDGAAVGPIVLDAGSVLATSRYNRYTPTQSQTFMIIDNRTASAVSGTFNGLPEGATFEQNGVVFKISYVGGDGNDVVLTVQNVPAAPNTGVQILRSNPILIGGITIVGAALLLGFARAFAKSRR